uniref:Protein phosphatase 1 regulatory subunit 16A n=1 Tax=Gadus morhua TaxID=8049 RepID=A0A8C4ZEK5_GADMO
MAAEHGELLGEMATVGRLSATERLKHAQKRRAQQLKGWAQMEKDSTRGSRAKADRKKARTRRVKFPDTITLLEAASRNDVEEVRELVKSGVSPDLFNEDGLTAMHQCCIDDYTDMVQCLLDAGACVNACDSELWTPLHAAATCGHTGLVQLLVQAGANLLAVNADGNMPYDLCEDEATLELLEVIMAEKGITQERIDECRGAKETAMLTDIQALVQSQADLNAPDDSGATVLHIVSANGYLSVAELLLENKAQVEVKDLDGWTPLHAAACWGQLQMVELLVAHGASLDTKSVLEETPLDVCSDEEVRGKILELKHKHDAIMKNQGRHKNTLQRRASSTASRGKVVRRVSVNERSSLYRREHHKEAMVWQERGRQPETPDDDEDKQTDNELNQHAAMVTGGRGGGHLENIYYAGANGNGMTREKSYQTLADLKRQRAAAKLNKYPAPAPPLLPPPVEEEPPGTEEEGGGGGGGGGGGDAAGEAVRGEPTGDRTTIAMTTAPAAPAVVSTSSQVYFTPASGDPPLLKLRAPEEEQSTAKEPCCRLM